MGKLKNACYGCWEMWSNNKKNPDWEAIGKANNVSASTAKQFALSWEEEQHRQDYQDREPEWIG